MGGAEYFLGLEACFLKNIAKRLTKDWMVVSAMACFGMACLMPPRV